MALLEVTVEEWVKAGIKGTIVNIGSSAEWQGTDSRHGVYGIQKRALRDRSLQLHGKQGIRTMHVTAGLLNDGAPQNRAGLDLNHVAQTIKWALEQPFCLPLLYIENT
jgi:NADP-dependent 3-hydroxy acid dehydrogenase YdfG